MTRWIDRPRTDDPEMCGPELEHVLDLLDGVARKFK
jgi:hypothetical protein